MSGETNKNLKNLICAGIVTLVLAGCAGEARGTLSNSSSIVEDGLEYYIELDKAVYNLGENVEMLYRVTNLRDERMIFNFGNPLQYNFHITDATTASIWKYYLHSSECAFCRMVSSFSLQPDESKEFNTIWNMINDNDTMNPNDDYPVQIGNYNVIGMLWHGLRDPRYGGDKYGYYKDKYYVPVSVSIEVIPEPASLLLLGMGLLGLLFHSRKER